MTDHDDRPLDELARLDPVLADAPPGPGSSRFDEILERAVSATDTERSDNRPATPPRPVEPTGGRGTVGRRRNRRQAGYVLGAAAAILAVVVGFVVFEPDRPLSPAAALTQAAENTGQVSRLRASIKVAEAGETWTTNFDVAWPDFRIETNEPDDDGATALRVLTVIGDTQWTSGPAGVSSETVDPLNRTDQAFGPSSEAVVRALLGGTNVDEVGAEQVRGESAIHYRVDLDENARTRLASVDPDRLAWFDIQYPKELASVDLWVSEDLVRRIRYRTTFEGTSTTTVELYDFGADITIEAPT